MGVSAGNLRYLFNLVDKYGLEILDRSYTHYSIKLKFKKEAIKRILAGNKVINLISLDLALPHQGILHNWPRKYKENGYTVINNKKGRKPDEGQR